MGSGGTRRREQCFPQRYDHHVVHCFYQCFKKVFLFLPHVFPVFVCRSFCFDQPVLRQIRASSATAVADHRGQIAGGGAREQARPQKTAKHMEFSGLEAFLM